MSDDNEMIDKATAKKLIETNHKQADHIIDLHGEIAERDMSIALLSRQLNAVVGELQKWQQEKDYSATFDTL